MGRVELELDYGVKIIIKMKKIQQPVEVEDRRDSSPLEDITYKHPSYGLIQISRITSNKNHSLFGSSINHQHTIVLRVNHARKHRSLSRDWYMDCDLPVVEVEMSAAQFAEAITSLNVGSGVPCTIRSINDTFIEFAPEKTKTEEHSDEYAEQLSKAIVELNEAKKEIDEILKKKSINKSDKHIISNALHRFVSFATRNSEFYKKQFDKQMEKTITEAKAEIESFVLNTTTKLGLEAMKDEFKLNS